jgi:hypothetical protein
MPPRTDLVRKQLELYEDAWKPDHEEVKCRLWRFEDNLAVGLALFKVIHDRYWNWRDRVTRGLADYDAAQEEDIKERFAWWLRPCKQVMRSLSELEKEYGSVEGATPFRRCYLEARQILESWTSPLPPCRMEASDEEVGEVIVPAHATRPMDAAGLAGELRHATRPAEESVPLKHPPDHTLVF